MVQVQKCTFLKLKPAFLQFLNYPHILVAARGVSAKIGTTADTMIDWELWHSTRELAATGSYKLAARRMGVNPTTIKRRKETLEKNVGKTLFIREKGLMVPTPAFAVALQEVENAAQHLAAAEIGLSPNLSKSTWRRIVITSVPFVCDKLLSPQIHKLPIVRRLRVEMSGRDNNLELTGNREADIALRLGPTHNKGVTAIHVANIDYATFVLGRAVNASLPWATGDQSFSHLQEVSLPEKHSGQEGIRFTATSTTAIQNMIVSGVAKGILPRFVGHQHSDLTILPDHPTLTRPLWIMWRDNALELPHFRSVVCWLFQIIGESLPLTEQGREFAAELNAPSLSELEAPDLQPPNNLFTQV